MSLITFMLEPAKSDELTRQEERAPSQSAFDLVALVVPGSATLHLLFRSETRSSVDRPVRNQP
jgi:hypothetical protein